MALFDELENLYTKLGLDPAAAKLAAIGRNYKTEAQAREAYDAAGPEDADNPEALAESLRAAAVPAGFGGGPRREAMEAAQNHLGYSTTEAADLVRRIEVRETGKGGAAHADEFLRRFSRSLGSPVRA
jgi:hypothetical protein